MRDFIIKNKIINSNKYGFIELFSKHSTNKKIVIVFLDLKKALGVVDHPMLLNMGILWV